METERIVSEKQLLWEQTTAFVEKITDRLGKKVDLGIKETVIVFNVLGFNTSQSCEGHLDWGEANPWVIFRIEGSDKSWKKVERAFEKAENAYDQGKPEKNVDRLFNRAHSLATEARRPLLEQAKRLMDYLNRFYKTRFVSNDARLTIDFRERSFSLGNQGGFLMELIEIEERKRKLSEYQDEMRAFTHFLKTEFFSQVG